MMAVVRKESMKDDLAPESFLHRHRSLGLASARHQPGTELYGKWRGVLRWRVPARNYEYNSRHARMLVANTNIYIYLWITIKSDRSLITVKNRSLITVKTLTLGPTVVFT